MLRQLLTGYIFIYSYYKTLIAMKEKTKAGIIGIIITTGLTLLCGLAYAINEKLGDISFKGSKEEEKF